VQHLQDAIRSDCWLPRPGCPLQYFVATTCSLHHLVMCAGPFVDKTVAKRDSCIVNNSCNLVAAKLTISAAWA
jgi:hypothetical protein